MGTIPHIAAEDAVHQSLVGDYNFREVARNCYERHFSYSGFTREVSVVFSPFDKSLTAYSSHIADGEIAHVEIKDCGSIAIAVAPLMTRIAR